MATNLKLPKGISDFRKLREGQYYFIDKSQFIAEVANLSSEVLLLPRPRRFGKTLNMTMLKEWFENPLASAPHSSQDIFTNLKVETLAGEHLAKRNKLPVIFLTFKDIKETTWEKTFIQMCLQIKEEVKRLSVWWQNSSLVLKNVAELDKIENDSADIAILSQTLRFLSKTLTEVSGERPLILIDEYDTPIHAALINGFYNEAVTFLRNFLSAGLKDNPYLYKGVLTGILRVSKENLFSGLNNIDVCSLTNQRFDTCFGLLENEVEELLCTAKLSDKLAEVREWYNGYLFGRNTIYNPWSVISFVVDSQSGCIPYWVNTADTTLLEKAMVNYHGILQQELEELMQGGTIEKQIDEHVTYEKDGIKPIDIWSFLLFTGYLKVTGSLTNTDDGTFAFLSIPNKEVRSAYSKLINKWLQDKLGHSLEVSNMLQALVTGDLNEFKEAFQTLIAQTLSFHDVKNKQAEATYHAFVIGLLASLNATHIVKSNRESGYGRYDVMLYPKNPAKFPGVIIEFKLVGKGKNPEDILHEAFAQINDKKYAADLQAHGCQNIIKWAIAFKGKEVFLDLQE